MTLPYEALLDSTEWRDPKGSSEKANVAEPEPQKNDSNPETVPTSHDRAGATTPRATADQPQTSASSSREDRDRLKFPHRGHNRISLRKVKTVDDTEPQQKQKQQSTTAGDEEEEPTAEEKPQKRPFPTRLWKPKTRYAELAGERKKQEEEKKRERLTDGGPRAASARQRQEKPKVQPPFANPIYNAAWSSQLPEAIDLSYVPPRSEEATEKTVAHLYAIPKKPHHRTAPPEECPGEEELNAITERLIRPKRRYDIEAEERPRYKVIEPLKFDEEDIEKVVSRLTTPRRVKESQFTPRSLPKLEASNRKAMVGRLYQPDFFPAREAKWMEVHEGKQGEGYHHSREKVIAEFDRNSPYRDREEEVA